MAEYDLTQKLIPHLDRHLAIPLLGHLSDIGLFPAEQLTKAQYDLVKGTNMVDYVKALHDQLPAGAESRDFEKLRGDATRRYEELQKQAQPVIKVIEDPEAVAKLKSGLDKERNLQLLETEYHVCYL
jgi:translation initiation factor 3 subunit E